MVDDKCSIVKLFFCFDRNFFTPIRLGYEILKFVKVRINEHPHPYFAFLSRDAKASKSSVLRFYQTSGNQRRPLQSSVGESGACTIAKLPKSWRGTSGTLWTSSERQPGR
jgi:hypothetical protein